MFPTFYFTVTWAEAVNIRRQLNNIDVPHMIDAYNGKVAFLFPDMSVRLYGRVREIFGTDGQRFI